MMPTSPPTKNNKNPGYRSRNKFNFSAQPMDLLNIEPQSQPMAIVSMEISELGKSSGVMLLETNYGAYVIKANNETPQDFFFNELALALGVSVPAMDSIACYEEQFQHLIFGIEKYCCDDEVLYARLKSKLDFPFFQVMEFIPSISLTNIGPQKFKHNLMKEEKLYSIGICLAFDMIINNSDRFSFVWRGQGNANNILVEVPARLSPIQLQKAKDREDLSISLLDLVFIDHGGNMPDKEQKIAAGNIDKYMKKVADLQLGLIMYLRKEQERLPQQFDKLAKQLQFFTKHRLNEEEQTSICQGIIYCTNQFIKMHQQGQIAQLYRRIVKPVNTKDKSMNYWNDHWNRELKSVNLSFQDLYYAKVSAIYVTYPEVINRIVEKVQAVVCKQGRKGRRRVSVVNRPPSSASTHSKGSKHSSQNGSQNDFNPGDKQQGEPEDQQILSVRQKKWREKLQAFKSENYK